MTSHQRSTHPPPSPPRSNTCPPLSYAEPRDGLPGGPVAGDAGRVAAGTAHRLPALRRDLDRGPAAAAERAVDRMRMQRWPQAHDVGVPVRGDGRRGLRGRGRMASGLSVRRRAARGQGPVRRGGNVPERVPQPGWQPVVSRPLSRRNDHPQLRQESCPPRVSRVGSQEPDRRGDTERQHRRRFSDEAAGDESPDRLGCRRR